MHAAYEIAKLNRNRFAKFNTHLPEFRNHSQCSQSCRHTLSVRQRTETKMQSIKSLVKTQSSGLITCFSVLFRRRLIRLTSVAAWSHTNRKLFTSSPIASENFRIATYRWSIASPLVSRISVRSYGGLFSE